MTSFSLAYYCALRRRWQLFVLLPVLSVVLAACGFGDNDEPEPVPPPVPGAPVGRAVLVYMIANNSLGSSSIGNGERGFDTADIREMQLAAGQGAFGNNRLILYRHAYHTDPVMVEVKPDTLVVLREYDTAEYSVQASRMRRVIADFKEEAPAHRYGIVLWSHASGWEQTGMADVVPERMAPMKAFGADGSRQMNVTTLAQVLRGEDFDYVYFDCCHMAGVEVAYELRDVTGRVAGSVTELPAAGMPYHLTLPYLMADEADVEGAAAATFAYYDAMQGSSRTCTMSVVDTSRLDALADAVSALYDRHPQLPEGYVPQKFIYRNCTFFDLAHYLEALAASDEELHPYLQRALDAIDHAVSYRAATPYIWETLINQVKIDSHCGLSTYILENETFANVKGYTDLQWYTRVAYRLFSKTDIE